MSGANVAQQTFFAPTASPLANGTDFETSTTNAPSDRCFATPISDQNVLEGRGVYVQRRAPTKSKDYY